MLEALNPEFLARAQAGDTDVIGELYDRYRQNVFRYLYYRVGDLHSAEDLTSEVFIRMMRSLRGYQQKNVSFEAWLFQIARNLAIDYFRHSNGKIHVSLEEDMISDKTSPDRTAEHNLTSDSLVKALFKLSELQRDVIVMRFVNGLTVAQVSQALHKSEDSIKSMQRRALGTLREILTEWEITYA